MNYRFILLVCAFFMLVPYISKAQIIDIDSLQLEEDGIAKALKDTSNLRIFVPNAFTPNGDGVNDRFEVKVSTFSGEFKIYIFNRWGQLIFEDGYQNFDWDGKINGKECQAGVYNWLILYKMKGDRRQFEKRGTVTLIR